MDWPLLASLDPMAREALLAGTRVRTFARGETIVHADDAADSLYLVEAGRVAVRVSTPDGDSAILNVLGPGDYFGELSLLGPRAVRSATIVALEQVRTRALSAAAFRRLRAANHSAAELLLTLLARRVEELSERLVEVMYAGMDVRVSHRLAELADTYAGGLSGPVVIPLTQDHLAELVGGTRPSVNQALQRLAARDVVELGRGRITVLDRAALRRPGGG